MAAQNAAAQPVPTTKIVDAAGNEACRNFYFRNTCKFGDKCTFVHVQGPPQSGAPAPQAQARSRGARSRAPRVPATQIVDESGSEACRQYYHLGKCPRGDSCKFVHVQGPPPDAAAAVAPSAPAAPARSARGPRRSRARSQGARPRIPSTKIVDEQGQEACRQFYYLNKCPRGQSCSFIHIQGPPDALESAPAAAASTNASRPRLPTAKLTNETGKEICRQFYYLAQCPRGDACQYVHAQGPPNALAAATATASSAKPPAAATGAKPSRRRAPAAAAAPRAAAPSRPKIPTTPIVDENGKEACRQYYYLGKCPRTPCSFVHVQGPPDALTNAPTAGNTTAAATAGASGGRRSQPLLVDEQGREVCRNFYTKAKCTNGDQCKYVHVNGPPADASQPAAASGGAARGGRTRRPRPVIPTDKITDEQGNEACRMFYHLGSCRRGNDCKFKHLPNPSGPTLKQ